MFTRKINYLIIFLIIFIYLLQCIGYTNSIRPGSSSSSSSSSSIRSNDESIERDTTSGWKLREDHNITRKLGIRTTKPRRDLKFRKLERIIDPLDDTDDDEDDDDDDQTNSEAQTIDDTVNIRPDNDNRKTDEYIFEKVNQANVDVLPIKKIKVNHPDIEQQDELETIEVQEDQQIVDKIISNVLNEPINKINYFWFFEWFTSQRKLENLKDQQIDDKRKESNDVTDSIAAINWKSYLDRKPFNIILNYFASKNLPAMDTNGKIDKINVNDNVAGKDDNVEIESEPERPLKIEILEKLLIEIPSFIPNYTEIENVECKRMGLVFQRQIRGQKLWAFQMMDASAKIPSGLLRGNTYQFGDFDLCTEIRTKVKIHNEKSMKIKGKYCLANIDIYANDEELKLPVHLLQGRNFLRSKLEDASHFLPRFSTLKWGICLPNACTNEDARQFLIQFLHPYNATGIKLHIDVDVHNCFTRKRQNWIDLLKTNWQMSVTLGYYTFFMVVAIIASLNDYWKKLKLDILFAPDEYSNRKIDQNGNHEKNDDELDEQNSLEEPNEIQLADDEEQCEGTINQMLMAFSIKRTLKVLMDSSDTDQTNDKIYCIYGLKAISTILLFISFKFMTIAHLPFTNRAHLTEILNSPYSIFLREFLLHMDTFLLLSGFLTAYKISDYLEKTGKIPWIKLLISRYIRLTPSILATILFTGWFWQHFGTGPQWGNLIVKNADLCKESDIWKNLLFIQNWFSFENQCAPYLVQLAIDMQFLLIAPIIIWSFHSHTIYGLGIFGILHGFSAAVRYSETIHERLSPIVFHGMNLSQLYRTINISIGSPVHRFTAYFIGTGLGVWLHQSHGIEHIKLPKAINFSGWLITFWSMVWCFWSSSHFTNKDYIYEPNESANFSTWSPLIWSLSISWIIFVCSTGNAENLSYFLSSKLFIFISKFSYQIYLIQFLVLFYFAGVTRSLESFSFWTCINFQEIAIIGIGSILMAIIFDLPMQKISQIIMSTDNCGTIDANTEHSIENDVEFIDPDMVKSTNGQQYPEKLTDDSIIINQTDNLDSQEYHPENLEGSTEDIYDRHVEGNDIDYGDVADDIDEEDYSWLKQTKRREIQSDPESMESDEEYDEEDEV